MTDSGLYVSYVFPACVADATWVGHLIILEKEKVVFVLERVCFVLLL